MLQGHQDLCRRTENDDTTPQRHTTIASTPQKRQSKQRNITSLHHWPQWHQNAHSSYGACSYRKLQVETSLNLLRTSRQNPTISVYEDLHGVFDYNKTPMAPIGTPEVVYKDPNNCGTWTPHRTDSYYVGPAMEHYRNQKFWTP